MSIARGIGAVVAGVVVGSVVNMGLIAIGSAVIPAPEGYDNTTMDGMKAGRHLLEGKHYIFPLLAHALGTLVGALVAAKIATTHKMRFAFGIGLWFLAGGLTMILMISPPTWFNVLDLAGAYIPMAWIGGRLATRKA